MKSTVRTPLSAEEMIAVAALKFCTFPVASWDKRFVGQLTAQGLSEKERPQVWRLFIRYRRQINCARKKELLKLAESLAAQDFRKLEAAKREQTRIDELKREYKEESLRGLPNFTDCINNSNA